MAETSPPRPAHLPTEVSRETERTPVKRPRVELPPTIIEEDELATPTSAKPSGSQLTAHGLAAGQPHPTLTSATVGSITLIQHPEVGPLELCTYGDGEGLCILKPETAAALSLASRRPLSAVDIHHNHVPLIRVEDVTGKGKGLVASKNIEAGIFILREQPLLLACMDARFDSTVSLEGMKPTRREALLGLHNSARGIPGMSDLHGIVATNAVGVPLPPDGEDHLAVCEWISRINHHCSPNARYYWDYNAFAVGLVSTKHIRAGSEITITYVDPFLPHLDREAHLLSNYGFTCDCVACQPNWPTYRLSETIRTTVNNLLPDADGEGDEDLVRWGGTTKAFVQRILNMLEVEGLQGERAEVLVRFAEFEKRVGSKERAQRMARWALRELAKIECEDASPDWAAMRELLQD